MKKILICLLVFLILFNFVFAVVSGSERTKSAYEIAVILSEYDLSFQSTVDSFSVAVEKISEASARFENYENRFLEILFDVSAEEEIFTGQGGGRVNSSRAGPGGGTDQGTDGRFDEDLTFWEEVVQGWEDFFDEVVQFFYDVGDFFEWIGQILPYIPRLIFRIFSFLILICEFIVYLAPVFLTFVFEFFTILYNTLRVIIRLFS